MPFRLFHAKITTQEIAALRRDDAAIVAGLENDKLKGRIRTGFRTTPSSATDVLGSDAEGDVVVGATYVYRLLSVSGVLKWDRQSLSVGW